MGKMKYESFKNPPLSYWMDSTQQPEYPILSEDIEVDVAIIGGGFVGVFTAYMLNKQGVKVALLEGDRILQGATGHTTAKITSQHNLIYSKIKNQMSEEFAQQYADANESAIREIEKIARENKIECDYKPESAYIYTLDDTYISKIKEEVKIASSLGIKASYHEEIPLAIPIKAAIRFDNQAQFHPRRFLLPLSEKFVAQDGQIFEKSRIVDIQEEDKYILISNKGQKVRAEKVIIASHYPCYNKPALYFARIYPERSYVVAIKAKDKYPGGMYITAEEPGRSIRSQASEQGELIFVGGEHHKTGQGEDTIKHYEALVDYANETFAVQDIAYRWSTQDCMTVDNLPYVGHFTSQTPNMYIATGFGKWGMTNSIVSGNLLTDLIVKGESPWQDVYNPSRQTILASAKNFIVENLNLAQNLVAGKIQPLDKDIELKRDEGRVVEANGQRTGAYRDNQGELHLVNTTCTHMGCELNWNSAEKSWDCPCHGSRFKYDGDIAEGPAVHPLSEGHDVNTIEKLILENF